MAETSSVMTPLVGLPSSQPRTESASFCVPLDEKHQLLTNLKGRRATARAAVAASRAAVAASAWWEAGLVEVAASASSLAAVPAASQLVTRSYWARTSSGRGDVKWRLSAGLQTWLIGVVCVACVVLWNGRLCRNSRIRGAHAAGDARGLCGG